MKGGFRTLVGAVAVLLAGALAAACHSPDAGPILVDDRSVGCFHDDELHYEWQRSGDSFVHGNARVSVERVEAIRRLVIASRSEPKDLLAQLGFTPQGLAAHGMVVRMWVSSNAWRQRHPDLGSLSGERQLQITYDDLAPIFRARLVPARNPSTTEQHFRAVLPGSPAVFLESRGGMPWMLPWKVSVGSNSWEVADPAISLAVRELADASGPSAKLLDGREYSRKECWDDALQWACWEGERTSAPQESGGGR